MRNDTKGADQLKVEERRVRFPAVIHHGITPAVTHGATTKKSAEAKTALLFRMP